ncbi:MAG: GAF domain-containing protein [Desulfomonile tiedjei]|nr:GAF domain-containing protein [Desulfomonile tiedjei]
MQEILSEYPFRCVFSFGPLVEFWERSVASWSEEWARMLRSVQERLAKVPELTGPIEDLSILDDHWDLVKTLMSAVFPPGSWETQPMGALIPISLQPVYVSPPFRERFLNADGTLRGRLQHQKQARSRIIVRAYLAILKDLYGVEKDLDYPVIRSVPDPRTGLERRYSINSHVRYVWAKARKKPRKLSQRDLSEMLEHITEPEVLRSILPPEEFELQGFTTVHAVDVTESEIRAELERSITEKGSIVSDVGFEKLQQNLRTLFRLPEMVASLAAVQGDQVLLLNRGCEMRQNCIFAASRHVPIAEFIGSVFEEAVNEKKVLVIRDLLERSPRTRIEEEMLEAGIRSVLVAPLYDQGQHIGTLKLGAPLPGELGPAEALLANQIVPIFSVALRRALQELDSQIDGIIKEKCTAIHPSVEWRFRKAVLDHLERVHNGESSELEPIVFREVYPLYAASDIRGSSEGRNRSIGDDLTEHLSLALDVVRSAWKAKDLPLLEELGYRMELYLDQIRNGLSSGAEESVIQFMRTDLEPLFFPLRDFGPSVNEAIDAYEKAMEGNLGSVYRKRKDFEESVSLFNQQISSYLDAEEARAQAAFPHYFEKHQTDGIEYVIYAGASLVENGKFSDLLVKSLRLWQIILACGIAWHADQLKGVLKVPLTATHLILAHRSPLAVRFRFDEKRFDVDGAYDVAHEIIRSRIDKATVRGRNERLTQPEKIAIVYSRSDESQEMLGHIGFLQNRQILRDDLEQLDLDDLPGVQGLRALRVGVNVESPLLAKRAGNSLSVS